MNSLTLFIPGLFLSVNDSAVAEYPSSPALQKILACSGHSLLEPFAFSEALSMLFNINKPSPGDYPIAAISRVIDDEHSLDGYWMRADPVHLVVDQAGLIMTDEPVYSLEQHDALVLAADISHLFTGHGLELEAPTLHRWYVKLEKIPEIKTTSIHEVIGKDINQFMPTGNDASFWVRLMNEIQMVLHENTINRRRESCNEKAINSVWFWGGGQLPVVPACSWTQVFTDEIISQGMARLAGIASTDLPDELDAVIDQAEQNDDVLVVMSFGLRHRQYRDINGWQDFIQYLEEFWFTEMVEYLKNDNIKYLTILTEYQKFDLNKLSLLKFWRSGKPLSHYAI